MASLIARLCSLISNLFVYFISFLFLFFCLFLFWQRYDTTPLHLAVEHKCNTHVVRLLLDADADVNAQQKVSFVLIIMFILHCVFLFRFHSFLLIAYFICLLIHFSQLGRKCSYSQSCSHRVCRGHRSVTGQRREHRHSRSGASILRKIFSVFLFLICFVFVLFCSVIF